MLTFLSQTEKSALEKLDYEYNTLMSSLHVSVSKHLLDEHFTVIWANDFYYEKIGYPKEEYERLFHNHVDEYFRDAPELLGLCDRILVLWRGTLAANLPTRGLTLDALLVAINGGQEPSP